MSESMGSLGSFIQLQKRDVALKIASMYKKVASKCNRLQRYCIHTQTHITYIFTLTQLCGSTEFLDLESVGPMSIGYVIAYNCTDCILDKRMCTRKQIYSRRNCKHCTPIRLLFDIINEIQ